MDHASSPPTPSKRSSTPFWFVMLFVVGLGIGIFGTWLFMQRYIGANTSAELSFPDKAPTAAKSTSSATDPNAGYFVIPELGVRFKVNTQLDGLTYLYRYALGVPSIYFSTLKLTQASPQCGADVTSAGVLMQIKAGEKLYETPIEQYPKVQKVGLYYYVISGPQNSCSDDPAVSQRHLDTVNALKAVKFEPIS